MKKKISKSFAQYIVLKKNKIYPKYLNKILELKSRQSN